MFGTTALITAWKYGINSKASLLETLPTSLPLHFAAALVAIQLCLTSAVSNNAMYQHMEDCLNISRGKIMEKCMTLFKTIKLRVKVARSFNLNQNF